MSENYTIIQSQLPVAGIGGHNFIVLVDPKGNIIREMHGLATDSKGNIKPIGYLPSDKLKVYDFDKVVYYKSTQTQGTLFSGSYTQTMAKWNMALACAININKLDLAYPFMGLGANSNSVASTLVSCMGLTEPGYDGAWLVPGKGTMLLSEETMSEIQRKYEVSAASYNMIVEATNPAIRSVPSDVLQDWVMSYYGASAEILSTQVVTIDGKPHLVIEVADIDTADNTPTATPGSMMWDLANFFRNYYNDLIKIQSEGVPIAGADGAVEIAGSNLLVDGGGEPLVPGSKVPGSQQVALPPVQASISVAESVLDGLAAQLISVMAQTAPPAASASFGERSRAETGMLLAGGVLPPLGP